MNPDGHPQTLVAKQSGNKNALRSGVFSVNALAPRVHELEASIAERTIEDVRAEVRTREIAALLAIGEAMDDDLAARGLANRSGEPRRMIELRLRLNKHLMRMFEATGIPERERSVAELPPGTTPDEAAPASLVEALAQFHALSPDEKLTPECFDPEQFLVAVVVTDDPATEYNDLRRAESADEAPKRSVSLLHVYRDATSARCDRVPRVGRRDTGRWCRAFRS